jgi:hypothetical protein
MPSCWNAVGATALANGTETSRAVEISVWMSPGPTRVPPVSSTTVESWLHVSGRPLRIAASGGQPDASADAGGEYPSRIHSSVGASSASTVGVSAVKPYDVVFVAEPSGALIGTIARNSPAVPAVARFGTDRVVDSHHHARPMDVVLHEAAVYQRCGPRPGKAPQMLTAGSSPRVSQRMSVTSIASSASPCPRA